MFAFGWYWDTNQYNEYIEQGQSPYLITLDVFKSISIGKDLGNSALSASCRTSNDEDVVATRNNHFGGLDGAFDGAQVRG